ncbi:MAG: glycosyltransferase, partial [Synergistales bacterium]|nr:glycosyltransferase [Synergistales bacterium]
QLSCFNTALPYLEGDYVFFLDSDDLYDREYLSRAVEYYRHNSICDFLFCKPRLIDREANSLDQVKRKTPYYKEHYGYTAAITWATHRWIGAATSCISMKRSLLEKILPIPYESDWITRADDCLVWGASLKGGYKCRLIEPLVNYRIHGQNYFQGREIPPHKRYLWELARNRVFQFLSEDLDTSRMAELLRYEFAALPELARGDLEHYLKAIRDSSMSLRQKLRHSRKVISHYFRNRSNK